MDLTGWAWLILPLGVTRAMQIALWDRITAGARGWLTERLNPDGYLGYLLRCPWCISVWIGGAAVGLVAWETTRQGTLLVLAALALSLLAVVIDRLIDRVAPDVPTPTAPVEAWGEVEDVPAAVAAALDELTGDHYRQEG